MAREASNLFMCLMGMGTVFVGLVCIVLICRVLGMTIQRAQRHRATASVPSDASKPDSELALDTIALMVDIEPVSVVTAELKEESLTNIRQQLIAAISTAIAEDLGTDVSGIRVLSFKQIYERDTP